MGVNGQLTLTVQHEEVLSNVVGYGDAYWEENDPAVASVSASLAVALYSVPPSHSIRIRALNPSTGATYYDDEVVQAPGDETGFADLWTYLRRGDATHAIGEVEVDSGSYLLSATASGWISRTINGSGTLFQADGAPGTVYRLVSHDDTGPSGTYQRTVETYDLDDLSVSYSETGPLPGDGSGAFGVYNPMQFGGGLLIITFAATYPDGDNLNPSGPIRWFRPETGWVDYPGGFNYVTTSWDHAQPIMATRGRYDGTVESFAGRVVYDPATDSFSQPAFGYRWPNNADNQPEFYFGELWSLRLETGGASRFAYGVVLYDQTYDDSGVSYPEYWFEAYVTDQNGGWGTIELGAPSAFPPDYVDYNTFDNYHAIAVEVSGNRWAAVLFVSAGKYHPELPSGHTDTEWQTCYKFVGGTISGGWRVGGLGTGTWSSPLGPMSSAASAGRPLLVTEVGPPGWLLPVPAPGPPEATPLAASRAGRPAPRRTSRRRGAGRWPGPPDRTG